MTNYMTFCVCATRARTWILTFVIYTCLLRSAICVNYTFWSAIWRRTNVASYTLTRRCFTVCTTLRIWTARRWNAWIVETFIFFNWFCWYRLATSEWVTSFTRFTTANWAVIKYFTSCT